MLTGINFVWTNHLNSIPSDIIHRKLTFYGKKAITVSSDMVPFLNSKLNINKEDIAVVYNALEKEKYKLPEIEVKKTIRTKFGINASDIVITLLGRLDPVKGHLFLIEAMNKIVLQHPNRNFKLVFTGRGSDEYKDEMQQLARKYKLNNHIIYTGYTDPAEILSVSDLMVLPSKNEGFPITCVEAFAMKVPVVRTKVGGYSDMKDYCIGVEYGDVESLSNAIIEVVTNESLKNNMINNAYSFFNEQLTSDKMARKILKIYGE
jgi:glycosyltransferase involved in cell wall biosynthesis